MNKENSAPARLLPTEEENPSGPPSTSGSQTVWSHQFVTEQGRKMRFYQQDADEIAVECASVIVDNSNGVYAGLQSHVTVAGAPAAELVVKYSPTLTAGDMADFAVLPIRTADALVPRVSVPIITPVDSRVKKLLLQLIARGGNGTVSPEMWNAIVSATSGKPPTVPRGGPEPPLPEDATWGNIVFDLQITADAMSAAYNDNDDVNTIFDQGPQLIDMTTTETLLLPKYRKTGIAGTLPCVEWSASNVTLRGASNPTAAYGAYTYYFVAEGLDGGDGARLWGAGLGDSFQYSYYFNDTQIYAANNNLFGSPSLFVTDVWGMPDRHIYRFTKHSSAASHGLHVNGDYKGSAGAAPQTNNNGFSYLMDHLGGLGFSGKICRVVAYDKLHQSSTATGAYATGLTAPESVLRGYWGTP